VDEAHFERLAEGRHPITDEALVRHQTARTYTNANGDRVETMEHRAGWDATFSAPKSVSLTALVGGDERVREAHRASVEVALDELEQYVQARIGRNHPAETTGRWVAATFEHDSARPVDDYAAPQLHTHAVFFNLTETDQGETHALQPRELYRTQQYATAVYRSELATHLTELGYEIDRGQSGQPEIRGYTPEYLEASSPRRRQIQEHLAQEEQRGAGPAQIAAHHTREAKLDHSHDDMQHRHQEMAAAFGDQPAHVVEAARVRAHDLEREPPRIGAQAAVTYAKDRNFEREAVVGERDLLRDALTRSMGEVTVRDIKAEFEHRVDASDFVRVNRTPDSPGRAFTTPEMIQLEHDTVAAMRAGQQQHPALVDEATTDRLTREHPHLSERQRTAVEQVLASRDQVMALDGVAGAGKTTVLSVVREAAEREGYQVEGFAPTSRAAQQLASAGMPAITLQRHLAQLEESAPAHKHLYVLDESSLASTTQMHAFLERLQPDDRILLVGDVRQHEAVDAGRPYHQLQAAGMDTAHLDDIVRQRDPALKAVVEQLARGEVPAALHQLDHQGRVHEIADRSERLAAMAREYVANPDRTLVVSPDNQSRREINDVIHRERQAAGQVDREDHAVRVLVPRQDLTGVDRQWAARYDPGDVVRYTTGSRAYGLSAAEYARVEHVDARNNHVSVTRDHRESVTYDPRRLQGVTVYREAEREFAVGDRVQMTAPDRERHLANRELGTIEGIDHTHPDRALQVRLDSGRTVMFTGESPLHLDYGYAVTSHSSQGQTADRVLVHIDTERASENLANRRFAYVALSRSRFDAQVYTNDKTELTHALTRDHSHQSAIEPGHALGSVKQTVEHSVALGSPGHHF